jgi:hypothetical protein
MPPTPRRRDYETDGSGNGNYVTRAELNAHLRPIRDDIGEIKDDVHEIRQALGAGPRWMGARFNALVDKVLPTLLAIAAVWVLSGRLG